MHTQGYGSDFVQLDHERTGNSLYLHEKWNKVPLTREELEAQEAAASAVPEKLALGGQGGFSLGGPLPKHRVDKTSFLLVFPGRQTLPLPCPELPDLVFQVIEAVHVRHALWETCSLSLSLTCLIRCHECTEA